MTNIAARPLLGSPTSVPTVDAHLLLQAAAEDAVAAADRAVFGHVELGHGKQADALAAGRCARQPGQHEVDDVRGHVVFAGRDEDLVAGQLVAAVRLRLGLGAQQAQVGAAMRLGQAHGAGPFARGQLGQIELLLRVGAVRVQRRIGAVRQAGVHGPGLIGRVHHLVEALAHDQRQALAAKLWVAAQGGPAPFDELRIGLLEALRRRHLMRGLVQRATLVVTDLVQRERDLGSKLAAFFEHGIDGVGIDLGVARDRLQLVGRVQDFVQHELHVAQGWRIAGHGSTPCDGGRW
jgi:hypothetical protein